MHTRPQIKAEFTTSVQASEFHYSTPRSNEGPYTHVEVGYPSVKPFPWKDWENYCEDKDNPTATIYTYVPVEVVAQFLTDMGAEVPEWLGVVVCKHCGKVQ